MTMHSLAGLSLRDLDYAAAVNRTRHFGQAAAECNVSQAALSEQLRKLETLLGTALFERGHRRVEPTEQGAVLLEQINRVLTEARGVLELARSAGPMSGRLRLGAIATLGPYYLPHLLRQVRETLPAVTLELTENLTDPLLDLLRRGSLDAVLLALPIRTTAVRTETLFFEPFHFVCPAGHPLAAQPALTVSALGNEKLLLLEEGHCLRNQALSLCGAAGPHTRQATSIETLWQMVAAGEGVSLLPALSLVGRENLAGLVEVRPVAAAGREVALAWRKTDPREASFATLANALRRQLPSGVQAV